MKKSLFYILILLSAVCLAACSGQQGDDTGTVGESVTPDIAITTVSPESTCSPDTTSEPDVSSVPADATGVPVTDTAEITTVPGTSEPITTTDISEPTTAPETVPVIPVTEPVETTTPGTLPPETVRDPEETTTGPVETTPITEETTAPITEPEDTTGPLDPGDEPEIKGWPTSFLRETFGEGAVPEPECRNADIVFNTETEKIRITGITLDEYYTYIETLSSVGFIYEGAGNAYKRLIGDSLLIVDVKFGETVPKAFSLISFEIRDARIWPESEISEMFSADIVPPFYEGEHCFFVQASSDSNSTVRIDNVSSSSINDYLTLLESRGFIFNESYGSYTKTVDTTIFSVSLDSDTESGTAYIILAAYSAPVWPKNLLERTFGTAEFLPEFVTSDGIFYSDTAGSRVNIIISDASDNEKKQFVEKLLAMGYVYSDELDGYVRRENGYRSHVCITDGMVILISVSYIPFETFPVSGFTDTVWFYTVPDFSSKSADFAVDWSGSDDSNLKVYGFGVTEEEVTKYIIKLLDFGYVNTVFDDVYSFSYYFLGKNVSITLKYENSNMILTFFAEYSDKSSGN